MVAVITGNGAGLERSSAFVLGSQGQLGSATLGRAGEGVFVNAATGNLVISREDEFLIGLGPDVSANRTYNSQATLGDGDNDDKWMMGGYRRLGESLAKYGRPNSTITRIDWDGSETIYTWNETEEAYVTTDGAGAYDTLIATEEYWEWTDGATGAIERYENQRLTTALDADGNSVTYNYDGNGLLSSVVSNNLDSSTDETITFSYSGTLLTQLVTTRADGTNLTRVRYGYADGKLATVTVDLSPEDDVATDGNSYVTSYTYETGSNRIATISQKDGSQIAFTYVLVGGDYKVASYTQTVAAGVTRTTGFSYETGRTIVTDPAGQKTTLYYNAKKELIEISRAPESGATAPRVTQFAYNANGDVTSVTDGPGNVVTYEYDSHGNVTLERDAAGNTVTRTYSAKNELLTETRYLTPDPDGAGGTAPGDPVTTRYIYDGESHLRFVIGAEGEVTQHIYDSPGRRISTSRYAAAGTLPGTIDEGSMTTYVAGLDKTAGERAEFSYDHRGNLTQEKSYSKLLSSGLFDTGSELSQSTYVYDQAGNLLSRVTNHSANVESFVYDGLNRMVMATDFGGAVTRTTFADARGQTAITHANGLSEISSYNRAGELVAFSQSSAGENLVELSGWPANPASVPAGYATVPGWLNWGSVVDETEWAATMGPDGLPVVAIHAGQLDISEEGGGGFTNQVEIDGSKAYEFTYYFKLSDLDKHTVFFGLSQGDYVQNAANGEVAGNPYFYLTWLEGQGATHPVDKWYKVVGYVLPEGSAAPALPIGGVYDVATGAKVADVATFRWNPTRTNSVVYSRFFDYYGMENQQYSTYFYKPEIRQVTAPGTPAPDISTSLYRYDNLGRLRMTIDPTGGRNYMLYDSVGRKSADIDADGSMIEYRYDGSDNLVSTTRYANKLSSAQLASLVDAYGNPSGATLSSLRPATDGANDRWTFQIYDRAERLIQTIDGTGATSVYAYDGASRLVSTTAYANRVSTTIIDALKTAATTPNLWLNPDNAALWARTNTTVVAVSAVEGSPAFQVSVTTGGTNQALNGSQIAVAAGDTVSLTLTMMGVGSVTTNSLGLFGDPSLWGVDADSTATIVSGPGQITQSTGGLWNVAGLSTTVPTRVTITRKFASAGYATPYLYVDNTGAIVAGEATIVAAPVLTKTPSAFVGVPAADAANDRVARNFYDAAGRLTGTVDGEGYLTEIIYDKAGRKTKTIAYSTVSTSGDTLAARRTSAGTDHAKDIHNYFVYDSRGLVRATVDGEGNLTRYHYDPLGQVDEIVTGQKLDPATLRTTPPTLANLPAPGSAILQTTAYTNDAYGRILTEVRSLTGGSTTTTSYSYDSMGRLTKTLTQSGGTEPRAYGRLYDLRGRLTGELSPIGSAYLATFGSTPTQAQIDNAYALYGTTFAYDKADRLISSIDPNGDRTLYYYDPDGNLAFQVNPLGETIEYRYNNFGQRSDVVAYASRLSAGTLAGMKGGTITTAVQSAFTTAFNAATATNGLSHVDYDVDGTLKQSTDANGNVTTYAYNAFKDLSARLDPLEDSATRQTTWAYERRGLLKTEIIDAPAGHKQITTSYGYDAFGRAVLLTNAENKQTVSTFDRAGRLTSVKDALNNITGFTYDARGNLVAVTDANAKVTRHIYDKAGRRIATIDATGAVTTTKYDADGRVVETRAYFNSLAATVDSLPLELTEAATLPSTSSADRVTRFAYDLDGRLRYTVDALHAVVKHGYDDAGNEIRTTAFAGTIDPTAGAYTIAYIEAQIAAKGMAASSAQHITRNVYNAGGMLTYGIDAIGQVTVFTYDAMGKVIKQVEVAYIYTDSGAPLDPSNGDMDAWLALRSNASLDRTTRAVYDPKGQLVYSVSALGNVVEYRYDKLGNVRKQIAYADDFTITDSTTRAQIATLIGTPGTARTTEFKYDSAGRLEETVDANGFRTRLELDDLGQILSSTTAYGTGSASVTTRTYSDVGRVLSETRGYGTADAVTTAYAYDGLGRMTSRTIAPSTADAATTSWEYDVLGRVKKEWQAVGTAEQTLRQFTYDSLGRLTVETDPRGFQTTRTYDVLGRVLTATVQVDAIPGNNLVTTNQYDEFGNLKSVQDPRLKTGTFAYDKLDRLITQTDPAAIATTTTYTRGGQVNTVTRAGAVTTFHYDKADHLTAVTDALGNIEHYLINGFGDRIRTTNRSGGVTVFNHDNMGRVVVEYRYANVYLPGGALQANSYYQTFYTYDARGNVTFKTEGLGLPDARVTAYGYDKLDRLISVSHDPVSTVANDLATVTTETPTEAYAYDKRGNLIQSTDAAGAKTFAYYDDLDRKTDELSPTGTLTHWTYDESGNVKGVKVYGELFAMGSRPASPPTPVYPTNFRETLNDYDGAGRLTRTTIANLIVGAFDGSVYGVSTGVSVFSERVYDKAGNVVREVDGAGNSTFSYYDDAGRRVAQVDREKYLTVWTLDAEGNALSETRYAKRVVGAFDEASSVATLQALAGTDAADRVTTFTYNAMGWRLTETRLGVVASTVSSTGVLATASQSAVIAYEYNALGLVIKKTEANGDVTDFGYDTAGRHIWTKDAGITEYGAGSPVRRMTEMFYDWLGNVVRVEVNKEGGAAIDDRVTTYTYGAGGRLISITDAAGFIRSFAYDKAGHVVKESYSRLKSDGTTSVTEAIAYRYDLAGRVVTQAAATLTGGSWTFGEATRIAYNAYGEMAGRGLTGGPDATAVYQETFDYDSAGRLWKTTQGDGAVRIMLYDKAGNCTLTLSSSGAADLSATSLATAAASISPSGGTTGSTSIAGAVTSIAVFDKRGQQIGTREPDRQLSHNGSAFTTATITGGRTYNAYGEVTSETDARGYTTEFAYSKTGRLIEKKSPEVAWTDVNGAIANARPTEKYYYDASGRMVAVEDANGNVSRRILLAGTGHDGEEALVAAEFHADNAVARTYHDVFRDAVRLRDELGEDQILGYDKMGRVTSVVQRGALLTDNYVYDVLGQRTGHWNSYLGSTVVERTDYDAQGRVVAQIDMGGDSTSYNYAWSTALTTTGLGDYDGWVKTTVNAAGKTMTESLDYFGRTIDKLDYGAHDYAFTFDKAGRLIARSNNAGEDLTYNWYNSGRARSIVSGFTGDVYYGQTVTSSYAYDAAGNRTFEGYAATGHNYDWWLGDDYSYTISHQSATATFDALNRIVSIDDTGASGSMPMSIDYEYDQVGNVRHMVSTYRWLDGQGNASATDMTQDYWYLYDSVNRFTTTKGQFTGTRGSGSIGRGTTGVDITYDAAGRRHSATSTSNSLTWSGYRATMKANGASYLVETEEAEPWDNTYTWVQTTVSYTGTSIETYNYRADGALDQVWVSAQEATAIWAYEPIVGPGMNASVKRADYERDEMGRVKTLTEFNSLGALAYSRHADYDARSLVTDDIVTTKRGNETWVATTNYDYKLESSPGVYQGAYQGGVVTHSSTTTTKNTVTQPTTDTKNTFVWWDGAQQATIVFKPDASVSTSYASTFYRDGSGHISSVYIQDGLRPRTVTFVTDANGLILQRDEADNSAAGDPREIHYYYNGLRVGDVSNNGTSDVDYAASIARKTATQPATPGAFMGGATTGVAFADFDQSYDPINGLSYQSTSSRYTVQEGDTLQSVALQVWGDGAMWYLIAQANGLTGGEPLVAGTALTIPDRVANIHNSSDTFKVYDPNKAMGDLSPTNPKPPKKANGCAVVGQILLVVIAVAVSAVVAPWATGLIAGEGATLIGGLAAAVAGGAIGGAAGAIASQAVGVATGLQDKFDWKGVGLAALAGGIGGGLGKLGALAQAGKLTGTVGKVGGFLSGGNFVSGAARGVLSNVLTQGIGVATGLQHKFDWAGVATAGVVGGVSSVIGNAIGKSASWANAPSWTQSLAAGLPASLAGAATRSVLTGTSFGDNIMAVLPTVIGSTIGDAIGQSVSNRLSGARKPGPSEAAGQAEPAGTPIMSEAERRAGEAYFRFQEAFANGEMSYGDAPMEPTSRPRYYTGASGRLDGIASFYIGQLRQIEARIASFSPQGDEQNIVVTGARLGGIFNASSLNDAMRYSMPRGWGIGVGSFPHTNIGQAAGIVRSRNPSLGGWLRGFTLTDSVQRMMGDGPGLTTPLDARMNNEDPITASMIRQRGFRNTLDSGVAIFAAQGHDFRTGVAAAPAYTAVQTLRGTAYAVRDPFGAAGGMVTALTTPSSWFQGIGNSFRNGDAFGLGLHGTSAAINVLGGIEAIGALGALRQGSRLPQVMDNGGVAPLAVVHGNSKLSGRTAYLYRLEDNQQNLLKWGITQHENVARRYTRSFLSDKEIYPIASGPRADMLALERQYVMENPGPLNREPWAVAARNSGRGR